MGIEWRYSAFNFDCLITGGFHSSRASATSRRKVLQLVAGSTLEVAGDEANSDSRRPLRALSSKASQHGAASRRLNQVPWFQSCLISQPPHDPNDPVPILKSKWCITELGICQARHFNFGHEFVDSPLSKAFPERARQESPKLSSF